MEDQVDTRQEGRPQTAKLLAAQYTPSSWPLNMPQLLAAQYALAAVRSICPRGWPLNMPQQLAAQYAPYTTRHRTVCHQMKIKHRK